MNRSPQPSLFETIRAEGGRIPRLDRHLERLRSSADAFGIPFDPGVVREELETVGRDGIQRVRLVLHPDGSLEVDTSPLAGAPFQTAWICPDPMLESGGVLCKHKTTQREHYEQRWRDARARGADEAILLNPSGEVVEGTRTSVWIEQGGRFLTPPLSSGGLPGVERSFVLESRPEAGEQVLRPSDLLCSDAVWLSNALRGLMRIELVDGGDGNH